MMRKRKFKILVGIFLICVFLCSSCIQSCVPPLISKNLSGTKDKYVDIATYGSDGNPRKITFDAIPERVVLDITNDLETLLSLEQGDRIALTSVNKESVFYRQLQEKYPEELRKVHQFSTHNFDMETVVAAQPDLIIGWKSTFSPSWLRTTSWWEKRGINTYIVATSNKTVPEGTIEEECQYLLDMGRIFGEEDKAKNYVDEIYTEISKIKEEIKGRKPPTVMVIEMTKRYIINYDRNWLVGDMVERLGGKMPVESLRLGQEDLLYYDPDVIFISYYSKATESASKYLMEDPKFKSMKAVKNRRIYPLKFNLMYTTGIRTIDGLRTIKQGLYPE